MTLNAGSPPEHLQLTTISWVIGQSLKKERSKLDCSTCSCLDCATPGSISAW